VISEMKVITAIQKLSENKATGDDCIYLHLLSGCMIITHRKSTQYVDDTARHCIQCIHVYVAVKLPVKSTY